MSEQEFQDYWRYVHAINYAMPIPQVRKYKIDCKIDISSTYHPLAYAGLAEIWLYYADGSEPFFDYVGHFSANTLLGLKEMMASKYWQENMHADFLSIADPWIHACMTVRSEWVIGPEARA